MWAAAGLLAACSAPKSEETTSTDTVAVETPVEEWISLFDGQTFNGWSKYGGGEVGNAWKIEDGAFTWMRPIKMPGRQATPVTLLPTKSLKIFISNMSGK